MQPVLGGKALALLYFIIMAHYFKIGSDSP